MAITKFPDVSEANEYGLLAVGGDLDPSTLLLAYENGVFPWPLSDDLNNEEPIPWFSPDPRAILLFEELHVSESLKRQIKNTDLQLTVDKSTKKVIICCAEASNRKGQESTWITSRMIKAYSELASLGHCHSVECWRGSVLVGGIYGVSIGKMFAGESMFFKESGASKLCLFHLVHELKNRGGSWLDCQQLTPLLKSFGAKNVNREDYISLLNIAVKEESMF